MTQSVSAQTQFEVEIETHINGDVVRRSVKARQHLADFVRDEMGLTGTHTGCEHGVCGSCSILLDGSVVRGCLVLAAQADGKEVETIEGASERGVLRELQQEFIQRNAAQCGFCTSGMLLTANELLSSQQRLSRQEIREFMSGNFCRCTGYEAIIDSVEAVMNHRLAGRGDES
ncbi:(2Fe-2S)-binding protein [Pusillimonas sp.]|uniref:(2Fe-2S)-binding protein n=1 Tax=Pusillimonas sp. TaxID=3040095 RepID=UPI0037C75189